MLFGQFYNNCQNQNKSQLYNLERMISRKIHSTSKYRTKQITILQVDPHGKFIVIYLEDKNQIHIIKVTTLTLHFLNYVNQFHKGYHFSDQQDIKPACIIPQNLLYKQKTIHQIQISKHYQQTQLMGVTNSFSIKTFQIKRQKIPRTNFYNLKAIAHRQIQLIGIYPIINFNFHNISLMVVHYDRRLQVFQFNRRYRSWNNNNQFEEIEGQMIRLATYPSLRRKDPEYSRTIIHIHNLYSQIQSSPRKLPVQNKNQKLKHLAYFSIDQLNLSKQCQIINQNNDFEQSSQTPSRATLYQTKTNRLEQIYQTRSRYHYIDKIKTISRQFQRPQQFQNQQQQYLYYTNFPQNQKIFALSSCQKYIVSEESEIYTVRSKMLGWNTVYMSHHRPFIHPFYYRMQENIYINMLKNKGIKITTTIRQYLNRNYQFFIIAAYLRFNIVIQLIVVDKKPYQNIRNEDQQLDKKKEMIFKLNQLINYSGTQEEIKQTYQRLYQQIKLNINYDWKVFNLFTIRYVKNSISDIKWINNSQFICKSITGRLFYFNILNNLIQQKIYRTYEYLAQNNPFRQKKTHIEHIVKQHEKKRQKKNQKRSVEHVSKNLDQMSKEEYIDFIKYYYRKFNNQDQGVPYCLQLYGYDDIQYFQINQIKHKIQQNVLKDHIMPLILPQQERNLSCWQVKQIKSLEKRATFQKLQRNQYDQARRIESKTEKSKELNRLRFNQALKDDKIKNSPPKRVNFNDKNKQSKHRISQNTDVQFQENKQKNLNKRPNAKIHQPNYLSRSQKLKSKSNSNYQNNEPFYSDQIVPQDNRNSMRNFIDFMGEKNAAQDEQNVLDLHKTDFLHEQYDIRSYFSQDQQVIQRELPYSDVFQEYYSKGIEIAFSYFEYSKNHLHLYDNSDDEEQSLDTQQTWKLTQYLTVYQYNTIIHNTLDNQSRYFYKNIDAAKQVFHNETIVSKPYQRQLIKHYSLLFLGIKRYMHNKYNYLVQQESNHDQINEQKAISKRFYLKSILDLNQELKKRNQKNNSRRGSRYFEQSLQEEKEEKQKNRQLNINQKTLTLSPRVTQNYESTYSLYPQERKFQKNNSSQADKANNQIQNKHNNYQNKHHQKIKYQYKNHHQNNTSANNHEQNGYFDRNQQNHQQYDPSFYQKYYIRNQNSQNQQFDSMNQQSSIEQAGQLEHEYSIEYPDQLLKQWIDKQMEEQCCQGQQQNEDEEQEQEDCQKQQWSETQTI